MTKCLIILALLYTCVSAYAQNPDILILNMGSPATPKLAKRLDKLGATYVIPIGLLDKKGILEYSPKAVIITGSPKSIFDEDAPYASEDFYELGIPVLGLCYGMQMIAEQLGGEVKKCSKSEKGVFHVTFTGECGITPPDMAELDVLMDHDDCVTKLPDDFITDSKSEITPHALSCSPSRQLYLIQFHPERYDTAPESGVILDLFVKKIVLKEQQTLDEKTIQP